MTARVLVVEHEVDDPIHLMGSWMVGVELTTLRPYDGDVLPATTEGYDGLVVMGGAMGANDDDTSTWLPATRDLIRSAAAAGVPTLGICLGHQLCAVALGGEVRRNPQGRQLGLLDIGFTPAALDDPLLGTSVGAGRRAMHWNDDIVTRLPEGAVQLATATTGDVQAARHARTVWGIQWHPEVDDRLVAAWADGELPEDVKDELVADLVRSEAALEEAWRPLAVRFSSLVSSASRVG